MNALKIISFGTPVTGILIISFALCTTLFISACNPERTGADTVTEIQNDQTRQLLIIVDGLRPDYITPEIMPNVSAMGQQGVIGKKSTAVFPSFTRPNRASLATGTFPGTHGLIHNTLYHPALDSPVHSGRLNEMEEFAEITGRPKITAVSLGELLDQEGDRLLALGAGAWMLNHKAKGKGWRSPSGHSQPEVEFMQTAGDAPGRGPGRTAWTVDLYLHDSLGEDPAEVVVMWFSEIDFTAHSNGVGAPETLEAVTHVDKQIGRILQKHDEHGLGDQVNIFITSDHGFTQSTGNFSPSRFAENAGLSEQVEVVRNMFYIKTGEREHLKQMVETLHRDENVGSVYTRPAEPGSSEGKIAGTFSTDLIQWTHDLSADILAAPAWSDDENEYGWAGTSSRGGTATHGSDSPFDLHIPMIAFGPDIKQGVKSDVPTGNVDFAPTLLHLRGIAPPESMDGRVMHEILQGGPDPENISVHNHRYQTIKSYPDGFSYKTELNLLQVDSTIYIQGARTERN